MKEFLSEIPRDKIKINWNKSPILMDKFLSFLTVETERGSGHLGHDNGWTRHYGPNDLIVGGGIMQKIEYLDSLQYGKKLSDPYSNYVNPFFIFPIMTNEGKRFFLDYYSEDIGKVLDKAAKHLARAEKHKEALFGFWESMGHFE